MDTKKIKEIVNLMVKSDLSEFEIEDNDFKLKIGRNTGREIVLSAPVASAPLMAPAAAPHAAAPAAATTAAAAPAQSEVGVEIIKSPMVGTFYRSPSPDNPPFVSQGDQVSAEKVVCIIEAMKVMNEIHAEMSGTIVEVLIEDGHSVEYGQPLFKVKKA